MLYRKSKDYMPNIFHQANTYNMRLNLIQASNITTKLSSHMIRDCVANKRDKRQNHRDVNLRREINL